MLDRESKSSYTYRVPWDDNRSMRKIHRLQVLDSGYDIRKIPDREIPNVNAVKNWAVTFYESKEMRDFETDELTGGTIPGLHEYRYSLDWEPIPETELIEMRHANGGGTRLKGEYHIGFSDPRLSDYAPVDFTVRWTPGEIKAMYDGEDVPNKLDYHHDPPMIDASEAVDRFRGLIQDHAREVGAKKLQDALHEYEENCNHDHAIEDESSIRDRSTFYCEDCGRSWEDRVMMENDEATVVGTTA